MSKTKSLLSIILFAILGTIVVSCGDEKITGVTLDGSWSTTDPNALTEVNAFQYEGVTHKRQCDKKYLKFVPLNPFATEGTGKVITHFPQGDLEYTYRTFTWTLDKNDPENIITRIIFDDNQDPQELILYRTHISSIQFSFSRSDGEHDPTVQIAFDRIESSSFDWDAFEGSGEVKRENWEEEYAEFIKQGSQNVEDLEEDNNEDGNANDGNE